MKSCHFLFLIASCITGTITYACDFHGRFGGSLWNGQHYPVIDESKITLTAPVMLTAVKNKKTELPINYTYATGNDNPTIELSLGVDSVVTADNKRVVLNGKSGQHTFAIVPNTNGLYRLVVIARTVNQAEPSERRQIIFLRVAEKDS